MSNPWDAHRGAVDGAVNGVGELQELISILTDRQESLMGQVIMAVGQNPNVESAQNAMNFTAEIRNRADEIYRIAEQVKAELERYAGGF